jgi:hypothetical protein
MDNRSRKKQNKSRIYEHGEKIKRTEEKLYIYEYGEKGQV